MGMIMKKLGLLFGVFAGCAVAASAVRADTIKVDTGGLGANYVGSTHTLTVTGTTPPALGWIMSSPLPTHGFSSGSVTLSVVLNSSGVATSGSYALSGVVTGTSYSGLLESSTSLVSGSYDSGADTADFKFNSPSGAFASSFFDVFVDLEGAFFPNLASSSSTPQVDTTGNADMLLTAVPLPSPMYGVAALLGVAMLGMNAKRRFGF